LDRIAENLENRYYLFSMPQKSFYVYIICNELRTVLYTGVTNNLEERIMEHYKFRGQKESFTARYNVHFLLYYETYQYINNAIEREKEIKAWGRKKKLELIATTNSELKFLNEEVFGHWPPKELTERF
jgi:putative endonuclease